MYYIDSSAKPKFNHRSRIFELDPCDGYSKVCLVYHGTKLGLFYVLTLNLAYSLISSF